MEIDKINLMEANEAKTKTKLFSHCICQTDKNICRIYIQEKGDDWKFVPCAQINRCRLWPNTSPWNNRHNILDDPDDRDHVK